MALPKYLALKSEFNEQYLQFVKEDGRAHGFLKFTGEDVLSPFAKFEVENSRMGSGLVHIRSCYNNKYWQRLSTHQNWIVASGDEPNEDRNSPGCTLFKPEFLGGDARRIRLLHLELGCYACLWPVDDPGFDDCMYAVRDENIFASLKGRIDVHTVIDYDTLVVLPKYVTFKADDDRYLSARTIQGYPYLQFASKDITDPTVRYEVFTNRDGSIRIRSDHFSKFWRRSPDWIWADSDDTGGRNPDTVFWPIKIDDKTVALRCLNAQSRTIDPFSRLEVCELVESRKISRVVYRIDDARIYNQRTIMVDVLTAINRKNQTDNVEFKFSYTEKHSRTWKTSGSLKLGVHQEIEAGIPTIAKGKIQISGELTVGFEWSETKEESVTREYVYKVPVAPRTEVEVLMTVTTGSCDVPFNYRQTDILISGERSYIGKEDAIFTGVNSYNIEYETRERPISRR